MSEKHPKTKMERYWKKSKPKNTLGKPYNKGTLADHINEIERKGKGATASIIIAETGNTEFKGIKTQAIWQMVDAIIILIMTYSCEGWTTNKEEKNKLQSISTNQ